MAFSEQHLQQVAVCLRATQDPGTQKQGPPSLATISARVMRPRRPERRTNMSQLRHSYCSSTRCRVIPSRCFVSCRSPPSMLRLASALLSPSRTSFGVAGFATPH